MGKSVTYALRDGVAILEIHNPPMNALSAKLCGRLAKGLARAIEEDGIGAVILRARGADFSTAIDPDDAGPGSAEALSELCDLIESFDRPVIAALHGAVLGPAFDLALAAHYRVAERSARLSYPEIRLGLLPSAGGTQRLPRLVGAEVALDLLLSGRAIGAKKAHKLGLVDRLVKVKAGVAAFALARELATEKAPPRAASDRDDGLQDAAAFLAAIRRARADTAPGTVEAELVTAVEAAMLLPPEAGRAFEAAARAERLAAPVTSALRHVHAAERRFADPDDLKDIEPHRAETVGIVGGGRSGRALALASLDAGLSVILSDPDQAALEEAHRRLGEHYDRIAVQRGLADGAVEDRLAALTMVSSLSDLEAADLVFATGAETDGDLIARLDETARPGAVLAVTDPRAALDRLSQAAGRRGTVLALAHHRTEMVPRAVEIVAPPGADPQARATLHALVQRTGRMAIPSRTAGPGIGARLFARLWRAADALALRGAAIPEIDAALREWGWARGPFAARDRMGLASDPDGVLAPLLAEAEARFYLTGSADAPHPAAEELIRLERAGRGLTARRVSAEIITRAALAALADEGASLIGEGVARTPADIDLLAIHGLGLARTRGGPMLAADLAGLLPLSRTLTVLAETDPTTSEPAPLVDDLIKNGRRFASLNAA